MKPMLSQRARSLITGVCRLVLAVVFIVSGFTKVIDPWGTSIKINEYLTIYGFDYLIPASMVFSIWLCGAEMMMGCMLCFARCVSGWCRSSLWCRCFSLRSLPF